MTWTAIRSASPGRADALRGGLRLLLVVTLLFAASTPAAGEDPRPTDEGIAAYLAELGSPARPDAVTKAWSDLAKKGPQDAVNLVVALGRSGGAAACVGVGRLLDYRDADLRIPALVAVRRIGLRSDKLLSKVRSEMRSRSLDVRLAACGALGVVGDGRDVPLLLEWTLSKEGRVRQAAFQALRRFTTKNMPAVPARWQSWWAFQSRRAEKRLIPAMDAVALDPTGPAATSAWIDVKRYAWTRLPLVERTLARWLDASEPVLRGRACELIGELGLADLGPRVRAVHRAASAGALEKAASATLRRLGVPPKEDPP